jgi:hypothetical protein
MVAVVWFASDVTITTPTKDSIINTGETMTVEWTLDKSCVLPPHFPALGVPMRVRLGSELLLCAIGLEGWLWMQAAISLACGSLWLFSISTQPVQLPYTASHL